MNINLHPEDYQFVETPEDIDDVKQAVVDKVRYGSPEWNDFVITHFQPNELYNETYPTLNGMRRVAELLLGQVVTSEVKQLNSSLDPDSTGRAFCIYSITINNFCGSRHYRIFNGAAEAYAGNISGDTYAVYPVTIAESRAEARAYRKALLLTTVTAEEVKGNEKVFENIKEEYNEDEDMSSQQETIIKSKCKQLGIDRDKFIIQFGNKPKRRDGIAAVKLLSEYQNQSKEIPKEII